MTSEAMVLVAALFVGATIAVVTSSKNRVSQQRRQGRRGRGRGSMHDSYTDYGMSSSTSSSSGSDTTPGSESTSGDDFGGGLSGGGGAAASWSEVGDAGSSSGDSGGGDSGGGDGGGGD